MLVDVISSIALDILDVFYLHFGCLWQGHLSGNLGLQYLPNKTASIISLRMSYTPKTHMEPENESLALETIIFRFHVSFGG